MKEIIEAIEKVVSENTTINATDPLNPTKDELKDYEDDKNDLREELLDLLTKVAENAFKEGNLAPYDIAGGLTDKAFKAYWEQFTESLKK